MSAPSSLPVNRLADEKSPYLLQHAQNPVDWHPWGEEAFALAREQNKPIFLSIGYSTCHWCHVMARESFENKDIAQLLNHAFINIKVDREERPDVDRLYMTYVQATTGHGGWPMSIWLTPELKPFFGGTYFPPEDRHGRTGFASIIQQIATAWAQKPDQVLAQGQSVLDSLRHHLAEATPAATSDLAGTGALDRGYQIFARLFDGSEGGWGDAPKFPRPVVFYFLFREYARRGAHTTEGRHSAEMALFTLRKMAAGGMHDHLGGGFHRYSVDEFWHVPHFEKMLYDQAQLAIAYLEAYQLTREPEYADVARDILDYVRRDMTDAAGGFYSAEDADSLLAHGRPEHAEGAFYVWTQAEIDQILGPEDSKLFSYAYGITPTGNAPEGSDPQGEFAGKNILTRRHSLNDIAQKFGLVDDTVERRLTIARQKLLTVRNSRPRPHLDDKIITAWNGLMISAFARAYQVLGDSDYLLIAQRAADFLRAHLTESDSGDLLRSYRQGPGSVPGFADDYAFVIQSLLDLYEANFEASRIEWAIDLQKKMDALFWDETNGGYFGTSGRDASVLLRLKEDYDGAEPSANSVAALNLLRLTAMTGNADWQKRAEQVLRLFDSQIRTSPVAVPQMLVALNWILAKPLQIVLATPPDKSDLTPLLREVHAKFLPHKVLLHAHDTEMVKDVAPLQDKPTAYVCVNFACQLPTNDPAQLAAHLRSA